MGGSKRPFHKGDVYARDDTLTQAELWFAIDRDVAVSLASRDWPDRG